MFVYIIYYIYETEFVERVESKSIDIDFDNMISLIYHEISSILLHKHMFNIHIDFSMKMC